MMDVVVSLTCGERAEAKARRPPLAPGEELGGLVLREPRLERAQERLALARAQRQVTGVQLEQLPVRAKARDRQRRREASHQCQRRSRRDVLGQRREDLRRVARVDRLSVVEHEHEVAERAQATGKPDELSRPVLRPGDGDRPLVVRAEAVERTGEPGEKEVGVVVGLVE